MKTGTFLVGVSLFFGLSAMADKCPDLRGLFDCPAHGAMGAQQMSVDQTGSVRKKVKYRWTYGDGRVAEFTASTRGVKNGVGIYGVCRNEGLYLSIHPRDLSGADRQEVSLTGNYVVTTFMAEPVTTCVRVSQ